MADDPQSESATMLDLANIMHLLITFIKAALACGLQSAISTRQSAALLLRIEAVLSATRATCR